MEKILCTLEVTAADITKHKEHALVWTDKGKEAKNNPIADALNRTTPNKWAVDTKTIYLTENTKISQATPGSIATYLNDWMLNLKIAPKQFTFILINPPPVTALKPATETSPTRIATSVKKIKKNKQTSLN